MYQCANCGYSSAMKLGKCPECGEFGTFAEDRSLASAVGKKKKSISGSALEHQERKPSVYFPFTDGELKRVFPKGIKLGGIYLLGGEPGIGKSTIALQIIQQISGQRIAYFSGEEQSDQIADRQQRVNNEQPTDTNFDIYHSNVLEDILLTAETGQYSIIVIDSIQTIASDNLDGAS